MNSTISLIPAIWKDQFPPRKPRRHSLIEKLICTFTIALTGLSVALYLKGLFKKGSNASHEFMDFYVLGWTIAFSLLLFSHLASGWVAVALTLYGLAELVNYRLFFLFVKSQQEPWQAERLRRSIAIVLLNVYEAVAAFAVLYLHTGGVGPPGGAPASLTPLNAFYFSLVTMVTIGFGDIVPLSSLARAVTIAEIATTVLFVVFLVPALVSVLSPALAISDDTQK